MPPGCTEVREGTTQRGRIVVEQVKARGGTPGPSVPKDPRPEWVHGGGAIRRELAPSQFEFLRAVRKGILGQLRLKDVPGSLKMAMPPYLGRWMDTIASLRSDTVASLHSGCGGHSGPGMEGTDPSVRRLGPGWSAGRRDVTSWMAVGRGGRACVKSPLSAGAEVRSWDRWPGGAGVPRLEGSPGTGSRRAH
jgi:hypothetical protein